MGKSPADKAVAAALALADAGDDDAEYERRRRRLLAACVALVREQDGKRVREAQRAARERGVRLGRPKKA